MMGGYRVVFVLFLCCFVVEDLEVSEAESRGD